MAEPFLRWVGGKRQLALELGKYVPKFKDYYEPFVGGGALFFAVASGRDLAEGLWPGGTPKFKVHLNDANPHLMNTYIQVRDNLSAVLGGLVTWDNVCRRHGLPEAYKECREIFNLHINSLAASLDPLKAARFIALNAWGFNGLCRFNKKGGYNVPCGKFAKTPVLMDKEANLRGVSQALQGVKLTCGDFAESVEGAQRGDFVYFDPPYIPASATSNFTGYTEGGFSDDDQRRLVDVAAKLVDQGVQVVLSNSDTPRTRHLYSLRSYWDLHEVRARRAVNCKSDKRGKVGELIIVGKI
jgi:DNA adenine methylase